MMKEFKGIYLTYDKMRNTLISKFPETNLKLVMAQFKRYYKNLIVKGNCYYKNKLYNYIIKIGILFIWMEFMFNKHLANIWINK